MMSTSILSVFRCRYVFDAKGVITTLHPRAVEHIADSIISAMASDGLRTICVAFKDYLLDCNGSTTNVQIVTCKPDFDDENLVVSDLTCLGIFGIEDPVRLEVPRAIRRCQKAGVTVRMVTGDNVKTARNIALKCGIIRHHDDSLVIEGKEFNSLIKNKNGEVRFVAVFTSRCVLWFTVPSISTGGSGPL